MITHHSTRPTPEQQLAADRAEIAVAAKAADAAIARAARLIEHGEDLVEHQILTRSTQ